ncbi:FUSC family protein [Paeniglutamicibacter antarcticus]|uniref:FUSC family protein n=1 Tax=Arthrobacter terrae TaxID=2935737 RepID=A0A931CM96_9MICC|nr:FUSC family protein [Arthrobacter terrae]MBG0739532.1 FUSC family protein [Arthrobacter terrae]
MKKQRVPLQRVVRTTAKVAGPTSTWRRLRTGLPVIAQCGLAAGVAWLLATALLGHRNPVFAATSAIICLGGGKGERGRQAVDLLAGVIAGVAVGELIRWWNPGSSLLQAVLAVVLGMSAAAALDSRRLAYIQGAASALFVLVLPPLQNPGSRIVDAGIGGVLGLIGSQILFTPDPVMLVSVAAQRVLDSLEAALRGSAAGLERKDTILAENAVERARDARSDLSDLAAQRVIARRIRTRTLRGLRRAARLRHLEDRLDHLDVLVAAVLLLTYASTEGTRSGTGEKPDGLAGFLVAAANDVGTLSTVLAERSRGNHPIAQLSASVPQTISDSAAVLAQTVADALVALAAAQSHPV